MRLGRARITIRSLLRVAATATMLAPPFWIAALAQSQLSKPTLTPVRLVDARGRPVAGAGVADFFWRDNDRESAFTPTESTALKTTDDRGEALLKLEIPGHLDGGAIFAIRQGRGRPLVGLRKVTREEIGKPITIGMYPACRVLFRIDSAGLPALEKKFNAELTGPGWWRAAYLRLGDDFRAPRPLFTCSTNGALEFLLPPGRFTIFAYGNDVKPLELPVEIKPDDRELLLGTIDLAPSEGAEQGLFPDHRRVKMNKDNDDHTSMLRRIHHISLHGSAQGAQDIAFSPDGKILATAHGYNADPGEVKLWDWATGAQVATLTVSGNRVLQVAFSPDGKVLAGLSSAPREPGSSWGIVLWDIASRRKMRTLGGHTGAILGLASSPDGKSLASSGADKTTRFWDVASGRENGRIGGNGVWGQSLVFAPDGRTLAVGSGQTIKLWDVAGDRLRATLEAETERFTVESVAYSPDGRTLAAAGSTYEPMRKSQEGQVRLYDVAHEPIRRRAVLTFDSKEPGIPNPAPPLYSDVAFTPDGRRVIAVAIPNVRTWDVATGIEQDAFQRGGPSGPSDRLAVSRDGRWLAITGPHGVDVVDIPPS
ncbi:MAG: WD40 repeat domain-containing protein [Isosphaerales bacterium]